jgi:hypothetical protein
MIRLVDARCQLRRAHQDKAAPISDRVLDEGASKRHCPLCFALGIGSVCSAAGTKKIAEYVTVPVIPSKGVVIFVSGIPSAVCKEADKSNSWNELWQS